MVFGAPLAWRELSHHAADCYFCLTSTEGFDAKNKHKLIYANVSSVKLPVTHSDDLTISSLIGLQLKNFLKQPLQAPLNVKYISVEEYLIQTHFQHMKRIQKSMSIILAVLHQMQIIQLWSYQNVLIRRCSTEEVSVVLCYAIETCMYLNQWCTLPMHKKIIENTIQ